ncbi:hypothetical protein [Lunatibacter salilacus]|uniref:hypothetical protein n=1 Tax=Lunatibacter salilacus TaxID=2483804 RepID=UPI00131D90C9|nr:hypothetical protein [Lunatibacter salilacus]
MKDSVYLVLTAIVLALSSCSNERDISPTVLYGTWEQSSYLEGRDLDLVARYHFHPDGIFERIHFLRKPQSAEIVGYTQYLKGELQIVGRRVKFIDGVHYRLEDGESEYGNFEDFRELEGIPYNAEAVLEFEKNNREVVMDFGPCNPILSSICIRHQRFTKVFE